MSESMNTRKRPAAPRSRDNSPPTQRRRQSEDAPTTERYADTAYTEVLPSPLYIRNNSAGSLSDDSRTRPAPFSTDGHYVNPNRRNSSRDALHGLNRDQVATGSENSRRPTRHRVMSPMSNRSGSSTPVQAAPTVPSMVLAAHKSAVVRSAPMDTLNALRSQKSPRSADTASNTNGLSAMEVRALKAQLKAEQLASAKLRDDFVKLEKSLKQVETLPTQFAALKQSLEQQQQATAKDPLLEDIERRVGELESTKSAIDPHRFVQLQSDLEATKTDIKRLRPAIAATSKDSVGQQIPQTVTKDQIKIMIQSASELESKKMDTFRTQQEKKLQDVSTIVEDLKEHDFPNQLKRLEFDIRQVESDEGKTRDKVSTIDGMMTTFQQSHETLARKVFGSTSPLDKASDENENFLQRIIHLEDKLRSLRKEQDGIQTNHMALSERMKKLPAVSAQSASPMASSIQSQLETKIDGLNARISNLYGAVTRVETEQKRQKSITSQISNFQSQLSKLESRCSKVSGVQDSLQRECNAVVDQFKKSESEQFSLKHKYETIAKHIKELQVEPNTSLDQQEISEKLLHKVQHLTDEQVKANDRIAELEKTRSSALCLNSNASADHADTVSSLPALETIQERLRSVEYLVGGENGLSTRFDDLQNDVEEMDKELHDVRNDVAAISNSFKEVFVEQFDPFKASVEERFKMHSRESSQHAEALGPLRVQVAAAQEECSASNFSVSQFQSIQTLLQDSAKFVTELNRLQESLHVEAEQRNAAVGDLKRRLASKQDVVTGTQAIDAVKAAVRSLQTQYDNISTDDLHQKMGHWFVQHYPTPAANMLQQFGVIQHEVAQLRGFLDIVTRIPNAVQVLSTLAQLGPQITALVKSPQVSKELGGMQFKTNEAVEELRQSFATAHTEHETLAKTVTGLQTSIQKLSSDDGPFVRTSSLAALTQLISALRTDLEAGFKRELDARHEFVTKASNEQQQRVKAETSIRNSITERFELLENGKIKSLFDRCDELQRDLQALKNSRDPASEEAIAYLPILFEHTGQMQHLLEALNQNLPWGEVDLEWSCDWKTLMDAKSPYPDATGEVASKGKNKQ